MKMSGKKRVFWNFISKRNSSPLGNNTSTCFFQFNDLPRWDGFLSVRFSHNFIYGKAKDKGIRTYISIRKLRKNEFDMPAFLKDGAAQNNEVLYENEHWTFYLASVEDQPAGIGVVFIKNNIANLAAAATLPTMRNKGVHQALINKRIQHAISMNCDFIVGQAKFGSISQNNMKRSGMRIAYTKAIWIPKNG